MRWRKVAYLHSKYPDATHCEASFSVSINDAQVNVSILDFVDGPQWVYYNFALTFPEDQKPAPPDPEEQQPAPPEDKVKRKRPRPEDSTCVVCMDAPANVAIIPCGHVCFCANCKPPEDCPICREKSNDYLKLYFP